MGKRIVVESGRDRRALVEDAGWKRLSLASLLAGVLVAYGAFAILAGIAGGILEATGADTDISARWDDLGVAAGLVVAGLLLLSYLFGGYVAGRMARRAGSLHGAGTFLLGVLIVAGVAVAVRQAAGTDTVVANLRDLGLPTTGDEWRDVGTVAGLASLAAMLVGAVLGGILGERWHAKLLSRAVDPDVGAEAQARRQASQAAAEAEARSNTAGARAENASLLNRRRKGGTETGTYAGSDPDRTLNDRDRDRTARPDDGTGAPTRATPREGPEGATDDADDVRTTGNAESSSGNGNGSGLRR